ncbi:MAG: ATP-binding protein [Desulfobacterales bacterium]|jgi:anti-sigma regulatory factor (Ser/Thr protein kinase)|nr:ATP-binding protein [Desulfobacterales bacterium]MDH3827591.1 ATP-binding protein [Desulfobacterales bacterium]MDH4011114.1 ATP-binding protein [Desulfobacterales bacterium]
MLAHKYSFELKSDLSELESLCKHLNKFGRLTGLSEACITDVNIGLDELFTNIVSYGFADDLEHIIWFTMNLDNQVLTLTIEDEGIPFNPLEMKEPEVPADLIDVRIGGLGIHIVRKLMDDIRYNRKQGRNKLTMKKSIQTF